MRSWFVLLALLLPAGAQGQMIFWNVENFFDIYDDPLKNDDAFTYNGEYHWNRKRYEAKRNLVAKTLIASSEIFGEMPALIGLAEVENKKVIIDLLQNTAIPKIYAILHKESPDPRGIDTALLYNKKVIKILKYQFITIPNYNTRDILYAICLWKNLDTCSQDTIHVFINHWPSKRSGSKNSDVRRETTAAVLSSTIDSLDATHDKILIMGDFNDVPHSPAITALCQKHGLINLAVPLADAGQGSLRYKGKWELIDQIIVSPALMYSRFSKPEMGIFMPSFLLEDDKIYLGKKPRRTYIGPRFNNGASDHLPVFIINLKAD